MAKINSDCDVNVRLHSRNVVEVTAIYNSQFKRRLYVGMDYVKAVNTFKNALLKGEI